MQGDGRANGLAETGVWLDGAEFDLADTTQLQDEFDLPPLPLPFHSAGGTGGSGSFGSDPLLLPQPSTEQDKKEKLRASNREKQQRFRQKQRVNRGVPTWQGSSPALCCLFINPRQMESCLEQRFWAYVFPHCRLQEQKKLQQEQFETTEADLERERLANISLREQHSVLDAMRQNQDAAVETLQKAAALDPPPAVACQRALSGAAASTSGGDGGTPGGGAASIRLHAMPFHKRVELCGQLFKSTAPAQLTAEQHGVHDNGQLVDAFGLDVRCAAVLILVSPKLTSLCWYLCLCLHLHLLLCINCNLFLSSVPASEPASQQISLSISALLPSSSSQCPAGVG
jgi:hypothetical protein